jgi:hypothetical protein
MNASLHPAKTDDTICTRTIIVRACAVKAYTAMTRVLPKLPSLQPETSFARQAHLLPQKQWKEEEMLPGKHCNMWLKNRL